MTPGTEQVAWMLVEALCVGAVLLALLRVRGVFGLAPVYMTLGVFFHLAGLLAGTLYVRVTPELAMSPGSVVFFPANILVVLFMYMREDPYEARRLIYGLFAANVVVALMGALVTYHLASPLVINPFRLAPELFLQQPRIALVGSMALFVDTILIVLVYEWLRGEMPKARFLPISISMVSVLAFDTLLFVTGSFIDSPAYGGILTSGLIGKSVVGAFYSVMLYLYVRYVEPERDGETQRPAIADVFQLLTYRAKYEALRTQVTKDALTGLHNRGFFNEALPRELGKAKTESTPVALLMIDVDHFKTINDSAGHIEGDRVLQAIASALTSAVRGSDLVCRYGGEEFGVILPETDHAQALALARRIQVAIPRACTWGVRAEKRKQVTVTIGVAASSEGATAEALITLADARLYAGKRAGRNRVVATGVEVEAE